MCVYIYIYIYIYINDLDDNITSNICIYILFFFYVTYLLSMTSLLGIHVDINLIIDA